MEDGKVIADSGPQITTRTKEDLHTEESENSAKKLPSTTGKSGDIPKANMNGTDGSISGSNTHENGSIVCEKIETRNTIREAKQERLQYHDETLQELTGFDIHKRALISPNELLTLARDVPTSSDADDIERGSLVSGKGKLTHYSSKSQRITDKEEVKEVSKMGQNGQVTTETTRTHHHEEIDDDEKPDRSGGTRIVIPEVSTETSRKIEFSKNYEDPRKYIPSKTIINIEQINGDDDHTNKWIENHFGSSKSSECSYSRCRTRAGGNKIEIELTSDRFADESQLSTIDRRKRSNNNKYKREHQVPIDTVEYSNSNNNNNSNNNRSIENDKRHTTNGNSTVLLDCNRNGYTSSYGSWSSINQNDGETNISGAGSELAAALARRNRINNSGTMRPTYQPHRGTNLILVHNGGQNVIRRKVFKEDASVQASLSDEESSEEEEKRIKSMSKHTTNGKRSSQYRQNGQNKMESKRQPVKKYYFGENTSPIPHSNGSSSGLGSSKDSSPDRRMDSKGSRLSSNIKNNVHPSDDQSRSSYLTNQQIRAMLEAKLGKENMHRSYPDSSGFSSRNGDMITNGPITESSWKNESKRNQQQKSTYFFNGTDMNGNRNIRSKDDFYANSEDTSHNRSNNNLLTSTRLGSTSCLCDRMYRSECDDRSSSLSRQNSNFSGISPLRENRLRNRKLSLLLNATAKDNVKFPEFSPLLSPLEIKNVSDTLGRRRSLSTTNLNGDERFSNNFDFSSYRNHPSDNDRSSYLTANY
ncbi:uncharacterized protein LOC141850960 isoform X2 [Brevipalpus obovatus]